MSKETVKTNDVTVKKQAQVPVMANLEEAAGQGSEYVTARDTKLPILKILYANSPVLDDTSGVYNEKAKQGDIYNEITDSLYKSKNGVLVAPCLYINTFNEWKDRGDSPGRPIAIHRDPSVLSKTVRGDDGKDILEYGFYIEDTGNHIVYILDVYYQTTETALITMKSTQKKKSKTWNSMIQSRRLKGAKGFFTPPSWSTVYRLKTTKESNSQNSWFGWVVEFDRILDDPKFAGTLEATKGFYVSAMKSDIFGKVEFESEAKGEQKQTKEVPF